MVLSSYKQQLNWNSHKKEKLEEVNEIVHSPENEVEKKQVNFSKSVDVSPQVFPHFTTRIQAIRSA